MASPLKLSVLLVSVVLAGITSACGNSSNTTIENIEGPEWNVTVCKAVSFDDSLTGVNTDTTYSIADTAIINQKLLSLKLENIKRLPLNPKKMAFGWTLPAADGKIWLVAYDNEPLLSETVEVNEANYLPSYDGNIQVGFQFTDAKKWGIITKDNIGKRLAVFVNGQLMNAPQVNSEINSGNCSVSIPADMVHDYLPNLDLEKLKQ